MRNRLANTLVILFLSSSLGIISPGKAQAEDKVKDPAANMSAFTYRSFWDFLMTPFSAFDTATGISTGMKYKVVSTRGKLLFCSDRQGYPAVYMLHSGIVREICRNGKDGRWYSDGSRFICLPTGDDVKWDMAIVDNQGKLIRIIKPYENGTIYEASFCPKTPQLIYFRGRKNQFSREALYSLRLEDNKITQLSDSVISSFAVSPDGAEIVFAALKNEKDATGQDCLWLMKADGSNARKLTDAEGDLAPAWSPTGGKITFSSLGKERTYRQIFIMDADGSNSRQLTTSGFHKNNPCWSPDEKQICYEAYTHDSAFDASELFVINSNGSGEARVMKPLKTKLDKWPTESKPNWVKD
jgi:Tol biopolymer transport system component